MAHAPALEVSQICFLCSIPGDTQPTPLATVSCATSLLIDTPHESDNNDDFDGGDELV